MDHRDIKLKVSINFFKGNYYVKIRTYSKSEKTLQAAESLALSVAEMLEGSTEMPAVLSMFPPTGKKKNEEMYINESVLGHKFLNRAFRANYESGPDIFSVFIFNCKSPEEAWKSAEALSCHQPEWMHWNHQAASMFSPMAITELYSLHGKITGLWLFQVCQRIRQILLIKYTSEILK